MLKSLQAIIDHVRHALGFTCDHDLEVAALKLQAIRTAIQHQYPTSDIEGMLAEIEAGYGSSRSSVVP